MELSFVITLVEAVRHSSFLNGLVVFFAEYWSFFIAAILLAYLVSHYKKPLGKKRAALMFWALVSSVIARFVITEIIRFIVPRMRPFVAGDFSPIVEHAASAALPSGHATFFMALAAFFLLAREKGMGWFLFFSTVAVSIARVFAGLHFPTDILAGWVLGALTSWGVFLVYARRATDDKRQITRLRRGSGGQASDQ